MSALVYSSVTVYLACIVTKSEYKATKQVVVSPAGLAYVMGSADLGLVGIDAALGTAGVLKW